jgi:hypothetical protein
MAAWHEIFMESSDRGPMGVPRDIVLTGRTVMTARILAASMLFIGSAGSAFAGVIGIVIPEPTSLAIYGAGIGAIYLIKKLRG